MLRFPHTYPDRPLSPTERLQREEEDLRLLRPSWQPLSLPQACQAKLTSKEFHVAVVGGGLAGLMAARRLVEHGIKVTVFEARKEVGGRVESDHTFSKGRVTEFGAELIGSFHTRCLDLALKYGLAMISRMDDDLYERERLDIKLRLDGELIPMAKIIELKKDMMKILRLIAVEAKKVVHPSEPWLELRPKERSELITHDSTSVADALKNRYGVPEGGFLWKMLEFLLVNDEVAPLEKMNFLGLLCKVKGAQSVQFSDDDAEVLNYVNRGNHPRQWKPLSEDAAEAHLMRYWTELEIFRCADGCQELATEMAKEITTSKDKGGPDNPALVRRQTAVTHINLSELGVTLLLKDVRNNKPLRLEPIIFYNYVILAIPPSVWDRVTITRGGKIAKDRKKDVNLDQEVGVIGMGPAVKFFSDVKKRFWIKEKAAPSGGSLRLGQVWEGTDNQTRLDDPNVATQGIVLSVFAGPIIRIDANGKKDDRGAYRRAPDIEDCKNGLRSLYPGYTDNLIKNKKNPIIKDWPKEPFIKTGYAAPTIGQIFKIGDKLTKPIDDLLFFAGEHTHMDFFGYMEGALRSGERAADTLINQACGLTKKAAPAPPSPQGRIASAAPIRAKTAAEYESESRWEEYSSTDYAGEAESPFFDRNLFAAGAGEEWEPRAAMLVAESPFVGALEERQSRFDEDQSEEVVEPDELESHEELSATKAWEELEGEKLTLPADQLEEEFSDGGITEDRETPPFVETDEALESQPLTPSFSEAEHYDLPAAEWSPELGGEQMEDFTGVDYEEGESQVLGEQPLEERFDPTTVPKDVANALGKQDWALALKLAIQAGWRDENDLTNLIFFTKHPELPTEPLKPDNPNFKQLSAEWTKILDKEVWKATKVSAENTDLVVSGEEVTDHHRFFWGKRGKRLKQLVEDAAREVDLNPGLLGAIMMAETRRPLSYLSSDKVSSYHIGCDDFYEGLGAIKARVPAYAKVKWDKSQKPVEHDNDSVSCKKKAEAKAAGDKTAYDKYSKLCRKVKTIWFDSGPDGVLATAVYIKFREVRLREIAAELGKNFDSLPLPTRFALARMAMAAGTGGATPSLKAALNGVDIFVREAIPVRAYQKERNATVRTAQAMHLSDWIFGIAVPVATVQPELETFEGFDAAEFSEDEFEDDAEAPSREMDPKRTEEVWQFDSEMEDDADLTDMRGKLEDGFSHDEPNLSRADLEENEFQLNRLPAKTRQHFVEGGAAWRDAVAEAIRAGIKNPNDLANLIFFMQHPERMTGGVGKPIARDDIDFFKLRAEWNQYRGIVTNLLKFPPTPKTPTTTAGGSRAISAGHFFLLFDGATVGELKSADGGNAIGPRFPKTSDRYEDFTIRLGFGLKQPVYDWVKAAWSAAPARKNGAIVTADFNLNAKSQREFSDALITEVTIPALDAGAKEPAYLTVKFRPESTRDTKASGKVAVSIGKQSAAWFSANFRLEIAGLDCTKVTKIDSFTVQVPIPSLGEGEPHQGRLVPGKINFPNLRITLPEMSAATWRNWHNDFVIRGNNAPVNEKHGSLKFLAADMKTELGRIDFYNLGIYRLARETSSDLVARVKAELYCSRMEFAV